MRFNISDITWGQIIKGLVHGKDLPTALTTLKFMISKGILPSTHSYTLLLTAAANTVSIQSGRTIHQVMRDKQVVMNNILYTSLINMYGKCASVEEAEKLMDEVLHQTFRADIACWNAMMKTYAQNRLPSKAIALFQKLIQHIQPDKITFNSLLTALSHGGNTKEALQYLHIMAKDFNVHPDAQHYTCVVDCLARAGQLEEAEKLINCFAQSDAVAWATLLGACRFTLSSSCLAPLAFLFPSYWLRSSSLLSNVSKDPTGMFLELSERLRKCSNIRKMNNRKSPPKSRWQICILKLIAGKV